MQNKTLSKSRNHHWWPVGLQKYWQDRNGDVSWITPGGKVERKRVERRKIAAKAHGHTIFKNEVWEMNFESEFASADDSIHRVIDYLSALRPPGQEIQDFSLLWAFLFKRDRHLKDLCKSYHLDEQIHRELLLLIYSLLIRSPANRFRYEHYPTTIGLPADETVGKINLERKYRTAKDLCEKSALHNQFFIIMHSILKPFIFGDGNFDWLTHGLVANRVYGKALLPLTPQLCVYFCTPQSMRKTPNCAVFFAAPWQVDWVNSIVQVYSKEKLFFSGKKPRLTEDYKMRQFMQHEHAVDEFTIMLDEIAGIKAGQI